MVVSPEVKADRHVTFRILAPKAEAVRLQPATSPATRRAADADQGRERRLGADRSARSTPGTYRYIFNVDGVAVVDPRNPAISESNSNAWSVVHVPARTFMDTSDVPHGAVAAVTYHSSALKQGPADARLHAAGLRDGRRTSTRSSTCCTAPATATTRGPPSAGPTSSSTT